MRTALIVVIGLLVAGCTTQRYGRLTEVSPAERDMLDCRDIRLEIARAEQFLASVRATRLEMNSAQVLGALLDFGIGNVIEGDAAELSGERRLRQLRDLSTAKGCG
jgi:hypothetical protein